MEVRECGVRLLSCSTVRRKSGCSIRTLMGMYSITMEKVCMWNDTSVSRFCLISSFLGES